MKCEKEKDCINKREVNCSNCSRSYDDCFIEFPKWRPKAGDTVFFHRGDGGVSVAIVIGFVPSIGRFCVVRTLQGITNEFPIECIKQFDSSKIGLKWEEI